MKILIVDDEKEIRESLRNIIKIKVNSNYEIKEASDGLEALSLVESFQPDIVLTDVMMPNMTGTRFAKILKSQASNKHIFIAAITGLSGDEEIQKIYESGIDFYIAKPFQIDDIIARLKVIVSLIGYKNNIYNAKPPVIYNCFNDEEIKNYFLTFSITKEDDIFLLFDYFSNKLVKYDPLLLKDFMVILVKAYKKMDNQNKAFSLIIEESQKYLYVTVHNHYFIEVTQQLVSRNSILFQYSQNDNAFSFRISISPLSQNKNNTNELFYVKNKVISAKELMMVVPNDISQYVEEINYKLQEYKLLCRKTNSHNKLLLITLINLFEQYTLLFQIMNEFESICIALQSILKIMKDRDIQIDIELKRYLKMLNTNIEDWITSVVVNKISSDVHYNDDNIINNCKLIEEEFNNEK